MDKGMHNKIIISYYLGRHAKVSETKNQVFE